MLRLAFFSRYIICDMLSIFITVNLPCYFTFLRNKVKANRFQNIAYYPKKKSKRKRISKVNSQFTALTERKVHLSQLLC